MIFTCNYLHGVSLVGTCKEKDSTAHPIRDVKKRSFICLNKHDSKGAAANTSRQGKTDELFGKEKNQ